MSQTTALLTPERWRALRPVLDEAMRLSGQGRDAFVEAAFPGDHALRSELRALVAADASDGGLLDARVVLDDLLSMLAEHERTEPVPAVRVLRKDALAGSTLGPYRLVREIGSGGMGAVYLAQRSDGAFDKEVALKVLRPGMDGTELHGRFLQERQILARLEHPGIARLLDGGATPDGRPYLVMELVAGQPCNTYCDEHHLGVEARLRLFLQMTDAVELAHRKLVVHRDLKPSNILVTRDGHVKLLDFGIAKLLEDDPIRGLSSAGRAFLTLTHASPEQVRGSPISTASDVYSLGVLLYELLAGRSPYRPADASRAALRWAVLENEPTPPSTHQPLSRDLDAIVLKALRKRPDERYPSVEAMAQDVRRFLDGRPVSARGRSAPYLAARFARRNPVALAATGLVLGLGILAVALHTRRLARERNVALREAEKAFVLTDFAFGVIEGAAVGPAGGGPAWLPAAELEARAQLRVNPAVGTAMLRDVARLRMARKELDAAARLLDEVLDAQARIRDLGELERAETLRMLGKLARLRDDPEGAARRYEMALLIFQRTSPVRGGRAVHTLIDLGNAFLGLQRLDSAEEAYRRAIAFLGSNDADPQWGRARNNLGVVAMRRGQWAEAAHLMREALPNVERSLDETNFELGEVFLTYADVLHHVGDRSGAIAYASRGLANYERTLPPGDPRLPGARALLRRLMGPG